MTRVYDTLRELVEREVLPALHAGDGVRADFPVSDFVQALRDAGLILWGDGRTPEARLTFLPGAGVVVPQGLFLVTDETGITPGFAALVERFDVHAPYVAIDPDDAHGTARRNNP